MAWAPKIEERRHPPGEKGVRSSLDEVAKRIRKDYLDPRIRAFSIECLERARRERGIKCDTEKQRADVLLKAVQKKLWVPDAVGSEWMAGAHLTACVDKDAPCFHGGDCFAEGTLLLGEGHELVPVEAVKPGMKIWGLDRWSTVEAVAYKGVLPIDVIRMNNGSDVKLTARHKIAVLDCTEHPMLSNDDEPVALPEDRHWRGGSEDRWRGCACRGDARKEKVTRVAELREGMVLVTPERIPFGEQEPDPDRAYIEGLFVADGCADWAHNRYFSIAGKDGHPKERQKKDVRAFCDANGIKTYWSKTEIRVVGKEWTLRVQGMGHLAPNKHFLSINLGEGAAAASLRGVMADSGRNTRGAERTFTTTSRLLALQTRLLHKMFGITCGYRYIENHGGLGKNPIYRLGTRGKKTTETGHNRWQLRVRSVERDVARVPCWDIQTDDHRVYLAEHDVTVQNCDDLCVMLGSCMMSVGLYTMVVGHAHDRGKNIGHVLLSVRCEGRWHYADPSTQLPLGETVEFTRERIISLPNQKVLCDSDSCLTNPRSYNPNRDDSFVSHGTFVGVDGVPKFAWLSKVPLEWLAATKQPSSAAQEAVAKKAVERGGGTSQADIEAYAEAGGAAAATAACAASGAGAVVIAACGPAGALIAGAAVKIFFAVFGSNEAARRRIATQTWQEWRDFAQKQVDATSAAQSGLRAVARAANDVAAAIKRDIMKLPPSAEFFPQFAEQEVYQALLARGMLATPGPDDIVPTDSLNKAGFYGPGERGFYFLVPCIKASGTDYDCVEHSTAYWRRNAAGADERVAKWFSAFEHAAQQLAIDLAVEGSIKKANNDRTPFSLGSLPNIQTPTVTFRPMRVSVTSKPSSAAPVVAGGIAIGLLAWALLA